MRIFGDGEEKSERDGTGRGGQEEDERIVGKESGLVREPQHLLIGNLVLKYSMIEPMSCRGLFSRDH